jgi:hypothetical protein
MNLDLFIQKFQNGQIDKNQYVNPYLMNANVFSYTPIDSMAGTSYLDDMTGGEEVSPQCAGGEKPHREFGCSASAPQPEPTKSCKCETEVHYCRPKRGQRNSAKSHKKKTKKPKKTTPPPPPPPPTTIPSAITPMITMPPILQMPVFDAQNSFLNKPLVFPGQEGAHPAHGAPLGGFLPTQPPAAPMGMGNPSMPGGAYPNLPFQPPAVNAQPAAMGGNTNASAQPAAMGGNANASAQPAAMGGNANAPATQMQQNPYSYNPAMSDSTYNNAYPPSGSISTPQDYSSNNNSSSSNSMAYAFPGSSGSSNPAAPPAPVPATCAPTAQPNTKQDELQQQINELYQGRINDKLQQIQMQLQDLQSGGGHGYHRGWRGYGGEYGIDIPPQPLLMSPPTNLQPGQTVICTTTPNTINGYFNVFRYDGNNTLRPYGNSLVADSWDPNWRSDSINIDCTGYAKGTPMTYNTGATTTPGVTMTPTPSMTTTPFSTFTPNVTTTPTGIPTPTYGSTTVPTYTSRGTTTTPTIGTTTTPTRRIAP